MANDTHNLASLPPGILGAIIGNSESDDREPASNTTPTDSLKDVFFDEGLSGFITTDSGATDPQMDVCIKFNLTADEDRPKTCCTRRVTDVSRLELEHLEIFSQSDEPAFNANLYGNIYRDLQRTGISLSIVSFWIATGDFIDLLESWQETLRHLRISCCDVFVESDAAGPTGENFKHIRDLKLEVLELHSMDMFNGPRNRHTLFEVPVKWQGKEQIREGLDEAIRKIDMLNGAEEYEVVILEVGKRFVKLMEQSNGDRRESA